MSSYSRFPGPVSVSAETRVLLTLPKEMHPAWECRRVRQMRPVPVARVRQPQVPSVTEQDGSLGVLRSNRSHQRGYITVPNDGHQSHLPKRQLPSEPIK